jgi:cobalt-zinc-cadmium efflux system membrane fusion protein
VSGLIRPNAQKSVVVRPRTGGRVLQVFVDIGESVEDGQTLCTLEGPDVTGAFSRYRTAVAREGVARGAAARAERLLAATAISRAERDARVAEAEAASSEAEAARQDLVRLGLDPSAAVGSGRPSEFRLVSPLRGTVLGKSVAPGLVVEKDAPAFEIAALQEVWAIVDVYEKDLGQIQGTGDAEVATDAYPGEVFRGRLSLVEPVIDEGTRTAHARIVLENRQGKLRPGLTVTAELPLRGAKASEAIAVPAAAVQKIAGQVAVFVESEPGHFALRPVETGRESEGRIEIVHGLEQNEKVVVAGAFVLKSELLKKTLAGAEE